MQKYSALIGIITSLLAYSFYQFFHKKNNKRKNKDINIYEWMSMGKKTRSNLDESQKLIIMKRKKELIAKSREEYLKYKKSASNKL